MLRYLIILLQFHVRSSLLGPFKGIQQLLLRIRRKDLLWIHWHLSSSRGSLFETVEEAFARQSTYGI
jgi:hypothetical protein